MNLCKYVRMPVLASIIIAAAIAVSSCKVRRSAASSSRLRDAIVTPSAADKAARIIETTRTYLPYEYSPDGCYARATYMQMELFAVNIPSRVVFIRTTYNESTGDWNYNGPKLDPEAWVYHVAPVIVVNGQELVLDPGLAPKSIGGITPFNDWLYAMEALKFVEAPSAEVSAKISESLDRFVVFRAGNPDDGPIQNSNLKGTVINTAEEMPVFSGEAALYNFKTMDEYLIQAAAEHRITENDSIVRRAILATRTVKLAEILEAGNHAVGPGGDLEGIKVTAGSLREIQDKNDAEFREQQLRSLPNHP